MELTHSGLFSQYGPAGSALQLVYTELVDWTLVVAHFLAFNVNIQIVMTNVRYRLATKKKDEDNPENVLDIFVDKKIENLDRLRKCRFRMIQTTKNNEFIDPLGKQDGEGSQDGNQVIALPTGPNDQQEEYAVQFQWEPQENNQNPEYAQTTDPNYYDYDYNYDQNAGYDEQQYNDYQQYDQQQQQYQDEKPSYY